MAYEGIILLLGILTVAVILLVLSSKIKVDDGGALQVLLIIFSVLLFLLVPKVALDYNNHCEILVTNETLSGNVTSYSYDYTCFENTNKTATSFYVVVIRLAYILLFYAFIYGLYKLYKYIKDRTKW